MFCNENIQESLVDKCGLHINRSKSFLVDKNLILGILNLWLWGDSKQELKNKLIDTDSLGNTNNIIIFIYLFSECRNNDLTDDIADGRDRNNNR